MTDEGRAAVFDAIADLCERAKRTVASGARYKATLLLRAPHLPDGDVLVTEDDDDAIVAAIARARASAARPSASQLAERLRTYGGGAD